MIEIRWHGRGGQGAVTAAEILAHAAIGEGKYAQAFPSFGPERRGAPVLAFNRIDDKPIWVRSDVYEPDIVAVLDPSLLATVNVLEGLKPEGVVIVNTKESLDRVKATLNFQGKVAVVNATDIALEVLKLPIVNTAMIGAFVKATGVVRLESVVEAVVERFGKAGKLNAEAVRKAYEATVLG
ncbi:MAG: hypothetical protein DRO52_01860 [Candidatus Hecatellales archaeon]|nr:MAG: hypothetical protein DRO52_01860 [Candidatus Hecatellales archaeon]